MHANLLRLVFIEALTHKNPLLQNMFGKANKEKLNRAFEGRLRGKTECQPSKALSIQIFIITFAILVILVFL
jgi:hypothetical protein